MKGLRQSKILELVGRQDIETQHALSEALREAGFSNTQATISRDIRELGLVKELGPSGRYRYAIPGPGAISGYDDRLRTIFRESVTSVALAQNLLILRTLPGLASAACSAIDGIEYPGLVGTIAGDDTAFVALEDTEVAEQFLQDISTML